MSTYLVRYHRLDGTSARSRVSPFTPAVIVDADVRAHLDRRYPTRRPDHSDAKYTERYGVPPKKTTLEKARAYRVEGGRLVALDHDHPQGGVRPFSTPGLMPEAWPLGEDGWPAVTVTDMTATVLGARVLVEVEDTDGKCYRDAIVVGTPDALRLANGEEIAMSTPASRCARPLPDLPFILSSNGTAWRNGQSGVTCLGRLCEPLATLADYNFSGDGPGAILVNRGDAWALLGELA